MTEEEMIMYSHTPYGEAHLKLRERYSRVEIREMLSEFPPEANLVACYRKLVRRLT